MGLFVVVTFVVFGFAVHSMWVTEEKTWVMMPLFGLFILIVFFSLRIISMIGDGVERMIEKGKDCGSGDDDATGEGCLLLVLVWVFNIAVFLAT